MADLDAPSEPSGMDEVQSLPPEQYDSLILEQRIETEATEAFIRLSAATRARQRLEEVAFRPPRPLVWDEALDPDSGGWLVPELLAQDTVNLLVAASNIGKTFASIDLICAGATGTPWAGRNVGTFKTLVFLSEGQRNYARRFQAWAQANGVPLSAITPHVQVFNDIRLTSPRYLEEVRARVAEFGPDLVIFDTFSGTSGVRDENDAAEVGGLLEQVRQVCSPAVTWFIHHPNKASEKGSSLDTRGSGTLRNNCDTVMVMFHADQRVGNGKGVQGSPVSPRYVTLSTSPDHGGKVKDASPTTIRGFFLEGVHLGTTTAGLPITSAVMRWTGNTNQLSKADRMILNHLPTSPTSVADYMAAAQVSRSSAYRQLEDSVYAYKLPNGTWQRIELDDYEEEQILSTFVDEDDETQSPADTVSG